MNTAESETSAFNPWGGLLPATPDIASPWTGLLPPPAAQAEIAKDVRYRLCQTFQSIHTRDKEITHRRTPKRWAEKKEAVPKPAKPIKEKKAKPLPAPRITRMRVPEKPKPQTPYPVKYRPIGTPRPGKSPSHTEIHACLAKSGPLRASIVAYMLDSYNSAVSHKLALMTKLGTVTRVRDDRQLWVYTVAPEAKPWQSSRVILVAWALLHPGCTTREISHGTGYDLSLVSTIMQAAARANVIRAEKLHNRLHFYSPMKGNP